MRRAPRHGRERRREACRMRVASGVGSNGEEERKLVVVGLGAAGVGSFLRDGMVVGSLKNCSLISRVGRWVAKQDLLWVELVGLIEGGHGEEVQCVAAVGASSAKQSRRSRHTKEVPTIT